MASTPQHRKFRFSMRTVALAFVVLSMMLAYVGSYYRLSRRGMDEAKREGMDMEGFLYVSIEEAAATEDLSQHHRRARFYAPLNFVDRALFGGDWPIRGILWRLE